MEVVEQPVVSVSVAEAQGTCWHCTSALNASNKTARWLRNEKGHLLRVKNSRGIKKKVPNPAYIRSVARKFLVAQTEVVDKKLRVIGQCPECRYKVSCFIKSPDVKA